MVRAYLQLSTCRGLFFFSSRRRHTRLQGDWSSDVCSSDLHHGPAGLAELVEHVDHDDAGGLGVDVNLTLQSLRGEDIDGHGGLLRARFRPIIDRKSVV